MHGDGGTVRGLPLVRVVTRRTRRDRLWTICRSWPTALRLPGQRSRIAPAATRTCWTTSGPMSLPGICPTPVWPMSEPGISFLASPVLHLGGAGGQHLRGGQRAVGVTSPRRTRTPWSCSPLRLPWQSPTYAGTGTNSRARADLQTLIDTSPVGVVVFDVEMGVVKSSNREARRIVDSLRNPGPVAGGISSTCVTCKRAGWVGGVPCGSSLMAEADERRPRRCGQRRWP